MKKLFSIGMFLLLASAAFAQSVEDKVWQQVEALHKAVFETKDNVVMSRLVADELTYGHSGGAIEDRRTMIVNASESKNEYRNPIFEKVSMTVVKKTAYVRYNFRAGSLSNGVETPLAIGILQVWQKLRGKWVLMARQAVKLNK